MDRAPDFESVGWGFESLLGYQKSRVNPTRILLETVVRGPPKVEALSLITATLLQPAYFTVRVHPVCQPHHLEGWVRRENRYQVLG